MKMQPSYVLEWQRMGTLLLSFYFIVILLTIAFFLHTLYSDHVCFFSNFSKFLLTHPNMHAFFLILT